MLSVPVVALVTVIACGCSAGHPASTRNPNVPLPPGCGAALAVTAPLSVPSSANQAATDYEALAYEQDPGTTAARYMRDLQADATRISRALETGSDATPAVQAWNQAMRALNAYCG